MTIGEQPTASPQMAGGMARMGSQRQELMKIICEVLRCPFYLRGTPKHAEVKVDSVAHRGGGGNGPTLGTGNKEVHYLYKNKPNR